MVEKKRKSEVRDNCDDESLCENIAVKNIPSTHTKKKKKHVSDSLHSEICSEDGHSVKRTKLIRTIESEENSSGNLLNGEDLTESNRKFSENKDHDTTSIASSEGVGLQNGIGQPPVKHKKRKKLKKEMLGSHADIVENVKKRRVSFALDTEGVENDKPAFSNPKKKRKRNDKLTQDVTTEDVPDEEEEQSAQIEPVVEPFSAKYFRMSLKAKEGVQVLKNFVSLIVKPKDRDPDVIMEYMQAGGNAMEILQQLETKEQETLGVASAVFTALHAIIMRSLTDMPDFRASCEEASRYLLNAYLPTVQKMLSEKASAQDMKATLKLLTGVVSINSVFAKDVLANVKFPPPILKIITKPIMLGEKSSVRTCFIHFLMAFLIDNNVSLIRSFLEKQGLLASILPGMVFDKAETVHLVLTAIRTSVVENKNVSKSLKRLVFNTSVIKLMLKVYSWHGPRKGFRKVWRTEEEVDVEARAIVTDALQQLMLVLCTSYKLGVVFQDRSLGTSRKNVNELMYSVLKEIERPWENEHTRNLVVRILVACPDLIRSQLNSMQSYLEPRVSPSWLKSMDFLKQIVEAMDPEVCLRPHVQVVPREQLASVVQVLCAPLVVVQVVKHRMLLHSGMVVRQMALNLLVAMFTQVQRFLARLEAWGVVGGPAEVQMLKARVTRHLPKSEMLLQVWNEPPVSAHGGISTVESPILPVDLSSHLSTLLDLMLLQHYTCPSSLPKTIDDSKKTEQPPKLELWELLGVIEQVGDETELASMQVKAVRVIFEVDRHWFQHDKKTFSHATQLLLKLLHHPASRVSQYACSVLTSIFQKTGLFDESPDEVNIWIHCYRQLGEDLRETAAKLLSRSLMRVVKNPEKYLQRVEKGQGKKERKKDGKTQNELAKASNSVQSHLSPLLPGILDQMNKKHVNTSEVRDFLNYAVVHLSHSLTSPSTMLGLVKDKLEDAGIKDYVRWPDKNTDTIATLLKSLFGRSSLEYKLSMFILGKQSKFADTNELLESEKLFTNKCPKIEATEDNSSVRGINDVDVKEILILGPVHLLLLFNLSLFQATQLISRGELTEAAMLRCGDTFKTLLQQLRRHSSSPEHSESLSPNHSFDLQCIRKFLSHPVLLNSFVPFTDQRNEKKSSRKLPTELILNLVQWTANTYPVEVQRDLLRLYKEKIVKSLVHTLWKKPAMVKKGDETFANIPKMIRMFEVGFKDVLQLLQALTSKPTSHVRLMVEDAAGEPDHILSTWGELLAYLIDHTVALREHNRKECGALPPDLVTLTANVYVKLRSNESLDLSPLEESLIKYLEQFPHSQANIPHEVLAVILKTRPEFGTSVRLGMLLLSRNKVLDSVFSNAVIQSKQVDKLVENSLLIFSYCAVFIEHGSSNSEKVLQIVYDHYHEDIVKGIKKPRKAKPWMVLNSSVVINMIEKCMPVETCAELCDYVEGHLSKLFSSSFLEFHIVLIESLFTKARQSPKDDENQYVRLLKILLELITLAAQTDKSMLDYLCRSISKWMCRVGEPKCWEQVQTSPVWCPFTIQVLKLGLGTRDGEYSPALLLDTLASLCAVAYADAANHSEVTTLFEMTLSHSEFLGVMLGSSPTKRSLVGLLLAMVAKSPAAMISKHVPILLGAYNATLSTTDQLLLRLVNAYEHHGVSTYECRPYLWGEAAVDYYCVKTRETVSLWRQPQMSRVLELLSMETVQNTVRRFPLDRGPELGADCADRPHLYDPAFFLPLFSHLLSPEAVVQPHKFTHSGGIALTLASLASDSADIRALAYHVLGRYHYHLDAARGRDREWWLQFLNAVGGGVAELGGGEGVQLACVVATFLARASLVISRPLDPMFGPLNRFILAKPAMNLNTIPELYILFNSTDLNSKVHRHFLLEVLRDGLRLSFDWQLAMKCVLFQLLFVYYSSIVSTHDERSKALILEVVNTAVKMPDVAKFFIGGYGFFSWFHQTVRELTSSDHDLIITSIQIVNSLWHAVTVSKVKTRALAVNKKFFAANVSLLLIGILSKLPPTMTLSELKKFLVVLQTVSVTSVLMTANHLSTLVEFCKTILGPLDDCEDMLEFGCRFIKKNNQTAHSPNEVEEAKSYLRQIIILWWESTQRDVKQKSGAFKNKKKIIKKKTGHKLVKSKSKKMALLTKNRKGTSKVKVKISLTEKKAKRKTSKQDKLERKKQIPVQDTNS